MRRFLKKRKIFTKAQKKRSEDGRGLAAGRFNLPAVVVYWLLKSCEAWYGKMEQRERVGRLTPGGEILAARRLRFAL